MSLIQWSNQFPKEYRSELIYLVSKICFISEKETIRWLVSLNERVLEALKSDGVPVENIIYITTDIAGSSSGVMLNLLKTRAKLERLGVRFLHSGEGEAIQKATKDLEFGAIIYIDDFAGTGKQFARSRTRAAEYIVGNFSEFFIVPCICEEALQKCGEIGVQAESGFVHKMCHRPLREGSNILTRERSLRLTKLCKENFGKRTIAMGFGGLATNVVFYLNAPNTTPLLFRGNLHQQPLRGILPRFDDL